MAELFKFRCYQCEKLLGISPRKAGRTVRCPRCGIELIVPTLDGSTDAGAEAESDLESDEPNMLNDLGIDLGLSSPFDFRSTEPMRKEDERPPDEVEAIAFLEQRAKPVEPTPDLNAILPSQNEANETELEPQQHVKTKTEPLINRTRRTSSRQPELDRRRDVVMPRTALVAWSLFALLALGFSFIAGLLIGHYRWK